MVQCLDEEALQELSPDDSGALQNPPAFGDKLKVNPPQYVDYSQVTLPERRAQRRKSIDISYQPPAPVEKRMNPRIKCYSLYSAEYLHHGSWHFRVSV